MSQSSVETFRDWLHPSDVVDHFVHLGEVAAKARVSAMLRDGILRAAAEQLVVDGQDHGLKLIPRELWEIAIHPGLWSTSQFRVCVNDRTISAYDVRIDRNYQPLPDAAHDPVSASKTVERARGGRPSATWWDDLWIEICRQLYSGDLKPDSQAAIERAMHDWLSRMGKEAGDTTIRKRASHLYRALTDEDRN